MKRVLNIDQLSTIFYTEKGIIKAVDNVSFNVYEGETLGIVGESGCGKSVTALSILRLIPEPPGKIENGRILLDDKDLLTLNPREMRHIRGNQISMIFQEPMTSLNPVFTVGNQLNEVYRLHHQLNNKKATQKTIEMLKKVGVAIPERRIKDYPHALSGGMRQRIMIGMALACMPKILIADEPTTALDVTIQAQILELIQTLQKEIGMAVIYITHDLGIIAEVCDRVLVMYVGQIIESAPTMEIFTKHLHPYTEGLLQSIPRLGRHVAGDLEVIPGMVPEMHDLPRGCRFADRCKYAKDNCHQECPKLERMDNDHEVACLYPLK